MMCRACRANPPATEGLCTPCWRDKIAAERRRQQDKRLDKRAERKAALHWQAPLNWEDAT